MMCGYRRYSTVGQMAGSVAMFAALALVLESGGLNEWAQRLDLGPERTVAVPVSSAVHRWLGWTGLERVRNGELVELARVGWSDDPDALAAVNPVSPAPKFVPEVAATMVVGSMPTGSTSAAPTTAEVKPVVGEVKPVITTPDRPLKPMVGDPPLTSALPALRAVPAGGTRKVALAGDSMMAVGLSSTILREAPKYKDLELLKTFKSGTGLARPEVFNWQSEYPAMLKDAKPDVVLVAIGANDGQGFVEGEVTYPFGSEGWKTIYQRRVQAFLEMLEADGATVVWVGLPPMKSDVYDAKIALVNRIDYAVVSASPRAVWFSSAGLIGDASGRFQDYGQVHGTTARLRQADGIHLSDEGAALLTAKLLPWLAKQEVAAPVVVPVVSVDLKALEVKP